MKRFEIRLVVTSLLGLCFLAGADTRAARADFTFGEPQNLGPAINTSSYELGATISMDGLELYFARGALPSGYTDIYVSTRPSVNDPWGPASNLGTPVNSPYAQAFPSLSSDGLTLYFSDWYPATPRPGGLGGKDIWMSTRPSRATPWGTPVNAGAPLNSSPNDGAPSLSGDGLTFIFSSDRAGGYGGGDLWMRTRTTVQDPWGAPVNLGPNVNSADTSYNDDCPVLSADGLALFFDSGRSGGLGGYDVWMTTRKSTTAPWGPAVNLGPAVNTGAMDTPGGLSADMRTLYFSSGRAGGFGSWDVWQTPILPLVDFNGDGQLDIQDLLRLIECWGKDDPVVDMGPMPWGDGKVDEKDLEVLMGYWGQEVNDPTLAAHWKLDEASGTVAADSAGANDGTLVGHPVWQPTGGKIGGALAFDGKDDSASSGSVVLDPAAGPFSVIAWVKGGAPSGVITSQAGGADWLYLDQYGMLATDMKTASREGKSLASQAYIPDDQWHRVVLTWDGTSRTLQMDGVEVARDTQPNLAASSGNLLIGAGKTLAPASFWTGLIDDVRVYNRAVAP